MSAGAYDLRDFEIWLRSWGAAPTTVTSRLTTLRAAFRIWGDPRTVTAAELTAWLANPSYSAWTRVAYYSHARSLFEWMRKSGIRTDDPTLDLRRPIAPRGRPRPLSPAEATLVLASASGHVRTWLTLGMLAGLRAHEMAKLRGEDVTEDAIYVVGKGGQVAMIPTHPHLWQTAQSYPRRGFWFPSDRSASGHVCTKSVSTLVTRLFDDLGIDGSSHRAWHSYATNLLRSGANIRVVQTLMRHESLAATALYTDVDEVERRTAIGRLAA